MHLPNALHAWKSPAFAAVLKDELEALGGAELPLQQGLTTTSMVSDAPIQVMVLGAAEEPDRLCVRVGVFFAGIVAGCSCADDPTPIEPQPEYCELLLVIDKATATAAARLAKD